MLENPATAPSGTKPQWRALLVAAAVIGLGLGAATFPGDDGLRHVGSAFAPDPANWGHTYPFSVYEEFPNYNPWYGHDLVLRGAASAISLLPVDALTHQVILVKILAGLFPMGILLLAIRRARIAEVVRDGPTLALTLIVGAALLAFPLARAAAIRPFFWGTPYLLFAIGATGLFSGLLSSALLWLLYPYLAWFYTIPAALAHLLRGNRAFAAGALVASAAALAAQPASFWGLIFEVARSASYRAQLDVAITEFSSALSHLWLYGLFFVGLVALLPRSRPESRQIKPAHLLLLLFLPFALRHVRYFLDLEVWLLFAVFGRDLIEALYGPFSGTLRWWGERARSLAKRRDTLPPARDEHVQASGTAPARDGDRPRTSSRLIKIVLVVGYSACLAALVWLSRGKLVALQQLQQVLAEVPRETLLLTEFNLQYEVLFVRPDLRLVPSSELGFWRADIGREYRAFFNRGDVCTLARRIGARFFLERHGMYLDPRHIACLELAREQKRIKLWRVRAARVQPTRPRPAAAAPAAGSAARGRPGAAR